MKYKLQSVLYGLFLFFTLHISHAVEPLPAHLVDLTSPEGMVLFQRNINSNALKLLQHFVTQKTMTFCGIASAVMILNSSHLSKPIDSQHYPYHYFTQEDFFNTSVNQIVSSEEVEKNGIDLEQLKQILEVYGLQGTIHYANNLNVDEFRSLLKNALASQDFVIVNFSRAKLYQPGSGHHSPLAAFDKETDRFLLLDVARFKYPAYWVKTQDLWDAVNTQDTETYRGFIIIKA